MAVAVSDILARFLSLSRFFDFVVGTGDLALVDTAGDASRESEASDSLLDFLLVLTGSTVLVSA
jgi:hypothetical protein